MRRRAAALSSRVPIAAAFLIAAVGVGLPAFVCDASAQAVVQIDPTELPRRVAQLEAAKAAERAALQASRAGTSDAYRAIDDKYLAEARKLHQAVRQPQARALEQAAGVKRGLLEQGGAGTQPEVGRGAFGDADTASVSAREFEAIRRAAVNKKFTVQGEGDFFTIKELGTTVHREPTRFTSAPGSSARQAEISRGLGHETSYNVNNARADANVAAMKNLEKGAQTLDRPASRLIDSPADLQEMGKMTQRNMEAGGIRNQSLRAKVDLLKAGYSPEAAGIVPPNATAAEKTAALREFQQQVREVNAEALRNTQAQSAKTLESLRSAAGTAEARLAQARASGDAKAIAAARADVQAARTEAIEFQGQQQAAREALVRHNPNGARVMAEAQGLKTELVNGPNGPRYRTPNGLKTPSQLADALTEPPLPASPAGTSWVSRGLNNAGLVLMGLGIYHGVKDAQERAGREAGERGDGTLTSAAKLGAYSVWNSLGFSWAVQSGQEGQARSMAQYQEDIRTGRVDSMSFTSFLSARARGVGEGVYQFLGFKGMEDSYRDYLDMKTEQALLVAREKEAETALARDRQRNLERAAARAAAEKAAAEKAAADTAARAASSRSDGETAAAARRPAPKPPAPSPPRKDDASVMPNLVRTSWSGEITMQVEGRPAAVLPITAAIDSYNKVSGSFRWSAWFDEEENQRVIELSGEYDSRTGALAIQADRNFSKEAVITQVFSVPTESGKGTETKRVEVQEIRRAGVRVRLRGSIDGPDAARGNIEIAATSEILVDGVSQGAGTDELRGTWRLNRRR